VNCRYDAAVELAISSLDWQLTESDPGQKNDADDQSESQTNEDPVTSMHRSIERALQSADGAPDALINRPDVGIEPTTVLFAPDATTLVKRTFAVLDALET
jgi:predicted fused transcriptional regulator/phosphomethylpyrimidine kinase